MLMIKNLDLIQAIQVNDFSNFHDRGMTSIILRTHKITKMNLQHASGDHWKNMRKVITRQFTPSRLKKQATLMDQCCSEFMEVLESLHAQDEAIEVHSAFQRLSLDVMLLSLFGGEGRTAIGREEAGPEIIKRELKNFMASLGNGWQRFIIDCFPEFSLLMRGLLFLRGYFMKYAVDKIQDEMSKMISQRLSSSTGGQDDLLQLLITAQTDVGAAATNQRLAMSNGTERSDHAQLNRGGERRGTLSVSEVQANVHSELVDSYDTLSAVMACMAFLLAKHPDVQERFRSEVASAMNADGSIDNDVILRNRYVEQVVLETVRLYPPLVSFTTRMCEEERCFNGLRIPAGMSVLIPVHQIHYDPELWGDPQKFRPERFSADNGRTFNPMAYQAFGNGPRSCVGLRYAQQQLKLMFAKILAKYKIIPDDRYLEEDHLKLSTSFVFCKPQDGVWLKFQRI